MMVSTFNVNQSNTFSLLLFRFNPDPRIRHSVWAIVIGGGVRFISNFGVNQSQVQRAVSVRSVARARL